MSTQEQANYFSTLNGREKILYKSHYDFELKYGGGTPETAHAAGVKKVEDARKLVKKINFPY